MVTFLGFYDYVSLYGFFPFFCHRAVEIIYAIDYSNQACIYWHHSKTTQSLAYRTTLPHQLLFLQVVKCSWYWLNFTTLYHQFYIQINRNGVLQGKYLGWTQLPDWHEHKTLKCDPQSDKALEYTLNSKSSLSIALHRPDSYVVVYQALIEMSTQSLERMLASVSLL